MGEKFTLLLLGPAGSGKSSFIAGLSKIAIFDYITASELGGANTTKITTIYEFNNKYENIQVKDCDVKDEMYIKEELLNELRNIETKELFEKINSEEFSKKCLSVTIQLPCKEKLIPENSLFESIVVKDSRGFGDIDDFSKIDIDDLGITYDINTILFFSLSSIQQPAIFSEIIKKTINTNLKTPILLLRRDKDLTKNDTNFEENIIRNISNSDIELSDVIKRMNGTKYENRLNSVVFNVPEVKLWKGVVVTSPEKNELEINSYSEAIKEILHYSIEMYDQLYKVLVEKMQGEYQETFVEEVLNQLLSNNALMIAAGIAKNPSSKPSGSYDTDRDTVALAKPMISTSGSIGEKPFVHEFSTRGNRHSLGTIPSYSYSCVNFRNIFRSIVWNSVNEKRLFPLFNTFLDIVLKDVTITASTGYTLAMCNRNAFKLNILVGAREKCTELLKKHGLTEGEQWKPFSYTIHDSQYENSEAIAVLLYKTLIESLDLQNVYQQYKQSILQEESIQYIETNKKSEVIEKLSRK